MSRVGAGNRRRWPRSWESYGTASESIVAKSDEGARGIASLSRRHPGHDWNAAEMVSPALWIAQSMGHSGGPLTWLPHGHVDAASRALAGETGGMAYSTHSLHRELRPHALAESLQHIRLPDS